MTTNISLVDMSKVKQRDQNWAFVAKLITEHALLMVPGISKVLTEHKYAHSARVFSHPLTFNEVT
jgi:hypothetical protein